MPDNNIVILTCHDRFFGQGYKVWDSMDVDKLKDEFKKYDFNVRELTFEEIAKDVEKVEDSYVFYSSTQKPGGYKDFIEDVLLILKKNGNKLIPSFDMFRAHENKGYQELLRQKYELENPKGFYFSGSSDFEESGDLEYPIVFKTPGGSLSQGVKLAKQKSEVLSLVKNNERLKIIDKVKSYVKKYLLRDKKSEKWYSHLKPRYRFVLQNFIPQLEKDYKVLVFNNRVYVLKRKVRDDDFRASGSGKFTFDFDVSEKLLDYAYNIYRKFNEPYMSLDIVEKRNGYGLIEFQGIHMGPFTLLKSPHHYKRYTNNNWKKVEEKSVLEEKIVESVVAYIEGQRFTSE